MTEKIQPTPEGEERLRDSKNLYVSLKPEDTDFNLATGIIYIFGFGNFLASQIDPFTGDYVYDEEAALSIRQNHLLVLHPPNAQIGDRVLIQLVDKGPDGSTRQFNLLFQFQDGDWEPVVHFDSRVVDMRSGKAGFARTTNPFQPI